MSDEDKPASSPESPNDGKDGSKEKSREETPGPKAEKNSFEADVAGNVSTMVQAGHADVKFDSSKKVENHYHYYNGPLTPDILDRQKRYSAGISDPAFTPDEKTEEAIKEIPVSIEQLDRWFYSLSDYDQCFVLAMAVFYGGSLEVVATAVDQLYSPLRELEKEQRKKQEQAPTEPVHRTPLTERLNRLYITIRRISGVERLYWQDTDTNNDSEFSTRLLQYIAREASFKFGDQEGQNFNQQLLIWVNDKDEDIAWRAARALGVSWWQNNKKNEIDKSINLWARSDPENNSGSNPAFDWHRAAWSLDGAYKVDKIHYKDAADHVRKSPVLKKLRKWVIKARNKQNISLGCSAAITYTFLGRSSPQVGMRGLDTLLELSKAELEQEDEAEEGETSQEIYEAVVFGYRDLALSGRIREVLQHLATYIKSVCYDDHTYRDVRDREERRRRGLQREHRIWAAFDILFWIARASFPDQERICSVSYQLTGTLPVKPTFGKRDGRDLLLEGILREDEKEWRNNISTLLCAALIERNTKLVFLLLHYWAELVMRDQSTHPDDVRKSYVRFMRDLAMQVDTWCHHLQKIYVNAPPAVNTFIKKLEAWKLESRRSQERGYVPIDLLAQEVLDELPFVDGSLVPSVQKV